MLIEFLRNPWMGRAGLGSGWAKESFEFRKESFDFHKESLDFSRFS